jgi:hypothetical protein
MHKAITIAGVVLAAGIATGGYTLWRVAGNIPSVQPAAPAARVADPAPAIPAAQHEPIPVPATSAATVAAAELSPDEQSPFGHAAGEQPQSGTVEFVGAATPDADIVPTTRESEDAVLEEARATLQALLENPDPNVRSEAATILERIDTRSQ